MPNHMQKRFSLSLLIPILFLLSSCREGADIKAAQELGKLGVVAENIFPNIANDVYQSCRRASELTLLNEPTKKTGEIDKDRKAARKICEENPTTASQALKDAHAVVLDYLNALGQLSSSNLTNYDKELNSIGESLQGLPGINTSEKQEAVDAGTAIAKFLFRAATETYRREALKNAVIETDPNLQTLIAALNRAVEQGYIKGVLEDEQTAVDRYHRFYLGKILTAPTRESVSLQTATIQSFDQDWKKANNDIEDKKDLARSYLHLLKKIAIDHHNLKQIYSKGEEPSPAKIKQMTDEYTKDLKLLTGKSDKLFKKNY